MSAPSPSWYDLLGVEPDASAEEIRAAWKGAIADLDPTDRRFRVLNQAAEVLLDPEQRAAYDETRAAERAQPASGPAAVEEAAPRPSRDQVTDAPAEPIDAGPSGPPLWILGALGFLAAVLVGLCVWLYVTAPPSDEEVAEATADAQAAAERAVVAIVSYDYRSLDDDQARAASFMTEDFQQDYEDLFAVIRDNAPQTKTIIKTEVVRSGIVRSGDDRVQVFLFIDTPTTNAETTTPEVYRNQVTMTMEEVGDRWLVDDLETELLSG